jgi:thiamine biosynthesis protein ThiI
MMFVSLLSGGIDSPVAAHMILNRGHRGILLHLNNGSYGGVEEMPKVISIAKKLSGLHHGRVRLMTAPHEMSLRTFVENANRKYACLLCKKAMMGLADLICDREGADVIVTGDSMGQVASQTLHNLAAVSAGVEHPIVRPLIGLDKIDIESIAREIGTYDLSSVSTGPCTAVPRYPITRADPCRLEEEAAKSGLRGCIDKEAGLVREVDISDTV